MGVASAGCWLTTLRPEGASPSTSTVTHILREASESVHGPGLFFVSSPLPLELHPKNKADSTGFKGFSHRTKVISDQNQAALLKKPRTVEGDSQLCNASCAGRRGRRPRLVYHYR
jgi:hypothetical protein